MRGHCLNSQEIRGKISSGNLKTPSISLEERIQPASFEPMIGNELFILDTETQGVFRPKEKEQVYRTLLHLPKRQRQKISLDKGGFELKTGFTYLLPLEERISLSETERIESSPKSSIGRIFLRTRMLADYNPAYEEIHPSSENEFVQPWLLVQPLTFNTLIYPGQTLNQLRWFEGEDLMLTDSEIRAELEKNPIISVKDNKEIIQSSPRIVKCGIEIHLDLKGERMEGIVGLRARKNPNPIDLDKKNSLNAEDYFEPIILNNSGKIEIEKGGCYLLSSKEVLSIPPHLSVQLNRHSEIGLSGPVDFAGFIDPGFKGDLVFEFRSDEPNNILLNDEKIPISSLEIFRSNPPDKVYGPEIKSNYQEQVGVRPAKYFKNFDYKLAAKDYAKLSRDVLVQDKNLLLMHRNNPQVFGFEWINKEKVPALEECIKSGFLQSRYDCEFDELILQVIPYIVAFGKDESVFSYIRADNIKDYGDQRLFGKHSIGLGGHISSKDAPDYLAKCISRELSEEVYIEGSYKEPKLIGTIMAQDESVDKVHFGLVYITNIQGKIQKKESSINFNEMIKIEDIMNDPLNNKKYETWSKMLIPHLHGLYSKLLKDS